MSAKEKIKQGRESGTEGLAGGSGGAAVLSRKIRESLTKNIWRRWVSKQTWDLGKEHSRPGAWPASGRNRKEVCGFLQQVKWEEQLGGEDFGLCFD